MSTKIEWTDETWNPVTGCTPVSAGCANCYARRMARRLAGRHGYPPAPRHFDVVLHPDRLNEPLRWKKPCRVFVCSMSDLFHKKLHFGDIATIFDIMAKTPQHTYQVLTKRPEQMGAFFEWYQVDYGATSYEWPFDNIWLGVTVENQEAADERIPTLLQVPAAVRFVSYEPALGRVDFSQYLKCQQYAVETTHRGQNVQAARLRPCLDWIIAGGETGPRARPAHPDWFRQIRDQCVEASVPFFLKQMEVDGQVVSMPELDGKVWKEWPK